MEARSFQFLCYVAANNLTEVEMALRDDINPKTHGGTCSEIQKAALASLQSDEYYSMNHTALHIAAKKGFIQIVKMLLERDSSLVAVVDSLGYTALFFSDHICIPLLLQHGANIRHQGIGQFTPLMNMASESNDLGIQTLLTHMDMLDKEGTLDREIIQNLLQLLFPRVVISIMYEYYNKNEILLLVNHIGRAHLPALGFAIPIGKTQNECRIQQINNIVTSLIKAKSSVHFNYNSRSNGSRSFKDEAIESGFLYSQTKELLLQEIAHTQ